MKKLSFLLIILATIIATGCNKDNPYNGGGSSTQASMFDPAAYNIPYNSENVWQDVYTPNTTVPLSPFVLTHSVGTGINEWYGFCPSKVSDTNVYSDWENHQWASVTGGAVGGNRLGYLVAHCDPNEDLSSIPSNPAVKISMNYDEKFSPKQIWLTTTTYTYYTMKIGRPGVSPINSTQWVRINIHGVKNGHITSTERIYIARDGSILGDPDAIHNPLGYGWALKDISSLGQVDYIYFQMESTYKDDEGKMVIPPYFVLGAMTYTK